MPQQGGLEHGAEVVVAGAGVAGCAFAIALLGSAQLRGLRLAVRLYEGEQPAQALPPVVAGPVMRQRLAALGVALSPEFCALELRGLLVWAAGRSELFPSAPGAAWVVDGWPAISPGALLLQRLLQQAAGIRGARFVPRPLDHIGHSRGRLTLRAGGAPETGQLVCATRALPGPERGGAPSRSAVRARLFASPHACAALGQLVRIFVSPCPGVDLLVAIPSACSVHLTAYGPHAGASELGLAMAELRRFGALPEGLEVAELTRARLGWGVAPPPRHPRILAIGDGGLAPPLDPIAPVLEQAQRAAHAIIESASRLEELPARTSVLLASARQDVRFAVSAVSRLIRSGARGPAALAHDSIRGSSGGGLVLGLGPTPMASRARLFVPALLGGFARFLRDEGPGLPVRVRGSRPIFVVDDDPVQRALLCEFLAARELPVRALSDELGLLAAAAEEPPRAVLLDVVLDWVDGLRLCRALRNHPATRNTPVYVMSGLARESDRRAALLAGATAFFSKPVDLEALAERLGAKPALVDAAPNDDRGSG